MFRFRNITRNVWLLSLVSLFTDLSSELLYPVMPVYLQSIGFSVVMIGILEGLAEATSGLSKGYFGNLSDHSGKRLPFVQAGYALSAFSKLILAFFSTTVPVFFARLVDRTGKGIRTSARDAMLSSETTTERKGEVFGFHRGFDTLGAAIGPLLALIYLYYHPADYKPLFFIAVIPGVLAIGTSFLVKEKRFQIKKSETKGPGFFSFLKYWKQAPISFRQLVPVLLFFALINSSDVFLLMMIKNKGYDDITMIGIYIFYNLLYALLAMPAGRLADRFGMKRMMAAGLFFFALTYGLINHAGNLQELLFVFGSYACYAACVESNAKAMITNVCERKDTATALGFYNSLSSICLLLASSWTGWLWMQSGPGWAMGISALGAFGCGLVLLKKQNNFT